MEHHKGDLLHPAPLFIPFFLRANLSLGTMAVECSDKLVVGIWYCLHLCGAWDESSLEE